ncbi:ABC transporter permease [Paraburkholderia tuberum]|uniref:Monosaccharide ABC transporter membrane protein, CUT2 family n=2 Tax=Paraburkholderia tuberum TaxID=157910 RepID=A0A1H1KGL0_9BURK|nr:ABC transporter permease [Paraburkholderia tuberum]SDR61424.1 monosaccharide ABC transporter membrane protein, CUT2 family [Paraburkholderia tuberum]
MNQERQTLTQAVPVLGRGATTRRLSLLDAIQDLGLLAVIVIGAVVLGLLSPVFFTRMNIENLLYSSTIIAVVAIGQAFVVLVAGIDLSVGAVLALSSVLCVGLPLKFGVPVGMAALISLALGALVGLVNGLAVTAIRIPALIATLAMMSIARGIAYIFSDGRNIAPVPDVYLDIQAARVFGIPVVIVLVLALFVVAHFVLSRTRFGRSIYATGGNAVAARLAGIRTNRVVVLAYVISGIAAALGGLMITARLEAGAATAGFGYELTVISAVVIGGVSLFGGEGKMGAVLLGVLLLGLVQNAINLLNVPANYDYVVSGAVIAIAASLDVYRRRYVEAGLKKRLLVNKKASEQERDNRQNPEHA